MAAFSKSHLEQDLKVGKLLYEIEDKQTGWFDCTAEWTSLQFYEHLLVARTKVQFCCFPPKYFTEAIPRFRILNATLTNGRRGLWRWSLFLFLVGIILLATGCLLEGSSRAALVSIGIIMMLVAPFLLIPVKRGQYVTIDIKGVGGRFGFSNAKTYTFRFEKDYPDEGFLFDYIFGPLRKGFTPFHALAHYHEVSLARSLEPVISNSIEGAARALRLDEEDPVPGNVFRQRAPERPAADGGIASTLTEFAPKIAPTANTTFKPSGDIIPPQFLKETRKSTPLSGNNLLSQLVSIRMKMRKSHSAGSTWPSRLLRNTMSWGPMQTARHTKSTNVGTQTMDIVVIIAIVTCKMTIPNWDHFCSLSFS